MKVFKKRNSLASLSIFAFILALLVIASFSGCEAASLIPVRNKQPIPDQDNLVEPEQTEPEAAAPVAQEGIAIAEEPQDDVMRKALTAALESGEEFTAELLGEGGSCHPRSRGS